MFCGKFICDSKLVQQTRLGSGCGAVGRAVASNTSGLGFESSLRQLLLNIYLLLTVCRKDENKAKEAGNGPFFLKKLDFYVNLSWLVDSLETS